MTEADRDLILRLEGKIDRLTDRFDTYKAVQEDHEERIRSTEKWKLSIPISMLLVAATVVGGAIRGGL